MSVKLYNTLSRSKEDFVPINPERVTMYVCGPTVYSYAHIGNARPAVAFDVLARVLRHQWPKVVFARNITDIDDKINTAAAEQGVEIGEITKKFEKIYLEDMASLGVEPPDIEPHATDHIPEMISMLKILIEKKHAYVANEHVLFSVPSYSEYGQLSRRNQDELLAGARVEIAPYKKSPSDFILWKPSTPDLPGWDSPWGRGRPGWHLECSCMIEKHLGQTIDIHGGGADLVFPHHENEIAQSTCAHGKDFVRYWLHNGFVNVDKEKMSKSTGNVLLVNDLLKQAPGEAIRLALLNAHYRQPLDWTDEGLDQAKRMLDRLYGALRKLSDVKTDPNAEPNADFLAALNDDLNTPKALATLFELARQANTATAAKEKSRIKGEFLGSADLLGLLQQDAPSWFAGETRGNKGLSATEIERLIEARQSAKQAKEYGTADRIRDELAAQNILLEDGPSGTSWRRT
ncbi:MAG: Cysteine--tRNA ligase [Alphaproteobacteria bacterium MarineAlpha11_Bin1]|nr:MAG: Cysteine--tRNA ligase [Alphaproteobacteria bacterium MarineAlpha11_Bin1]|tara:strand:+ start:2873 stop:4252 length:1380 start_codon:yes stop_codon:yes gene_type:complete